MTELLIYRPSNFTPSVIVEYVGLTPDARIILREVGRPLRGVLVAEIHQVKRVPPTKGEANG